MFHYSEWALKRDEELATKIFTEPTEELNSDKVLNFLSPFKTATVSYLEHIIHGQGSKVSLQYTNSNLRVNYFPRVTGILRRSEDLPRSLGKLYAKERGDGLMITPLL